MKLRGIRCCRWSWCCLWGRRRRRKRHENECSLVGTQEGRGGKGGRGVGAHSSRVKQRNEEAKEEGGRSIHTRNSLGVGRCLILLTSGNVLKSLSWVLGGHLVETRRNEAQRRETLVEPVINQQ